MTDIAAVFHDFARRHLAGRVLGASVPADVWEAMAAAGLFRVGLPAEHGGDGAALSAIAAAERGLIGGGASPGLGTVWGGHQMVARYFIAGFGNAAQQAMWLPRLAAGASTAAIAISEPKVGAHPKLLTTRAERIAGGWRIEGEKSFLTNGPIADLFIVLAITGETAGRKRYSCLLVPDGTPGLARTAAADYPALHPAGHCGLRLAGCEVPEAALLGPEGEAYERMALPFRDLEDGIGVSGTAGNIAAMLGAMAAGLPETEDVQRDAALGGLIGLSAMLDVAAAEVAAALDSGRTAQALMIGIRALSARMAAEIRALSPGADVVARLAALDVGLSVARGPRAVRAARLARGLGAAGGG